jgi:hypothetical protein
MNPEPARTGYSAALKYYSVALTCFCAFLLWMCYSYSTKVDNYSAFQAKVHCKELADAYIKQIPTWTLEQVQYAPATGTCFAAYLSSTDVSAGKYSFMGQIVDLTSGQFFISTAYSGSDKSCTPKQASRKLEDEFWEKVNATRLSTRTLGISDSKTCMNIDNVSDLQ